MRFGYVLIAMATCFCPMATAENAKAEIRKLKAENRLLKKELYRLRKEVKALKRAKGRTATSKTRSARKAKRQTSEREAAEMIGTERIEKLGGLMASLGTFMGMDSPARQEAIANLQASAKEIEKLFSEQ